MTRPSVIDRLSDLDTGDQVTLTVDGDELRGEVSYRHRRPARQTDGVPSRGEVAVDIDLASGTVETHDLASEHLEVTVTETRPGRWETPEVELWAPVVHEDGYVVEDEFVGLGELEDLEADR